VHQERTEQKLTKSETALLDLGNVTFLNNQSLVLDITELLSFSGTALLIISDE
jgi:hypothetical protein